MKLNRLFQFTMLSLLILVTGVTVLFAQSEDQEANVLHVDVVENAARFVFDPSITFEDGMPAYGTSFVTEGYIYPEGTLDGSSNGVLEDGSPEFPDLVLGTWTCFGTFVGDGMYTETGAVVITNQVFSFYGEDSPSTIISTGFELIDVEVPIERAITGGTGTYNGATGTQTQELIGFTDYMGFQLRIELAQSN